MLRIRKLDDTRESVYDYFDRVIAYAVLLAALGALLSMIALFVVGIYQVGYGVWNYVEHAIFGQGEYSTLTTKVIHGVELLILAPVPYLILGALRGYLVQASTPEADNAAHAELLRVKAFIGGLLFALLATNATGAALEKALTLEVALGSAALMVVLVGYFWVLERKASAHG